MNDPSADAVLTLYVHLSRVPQSKSDSIDIPLESECPPVPDINENGVELAKRWLKDGKLPTAVSDIKSIEAGKNLIDLLDLFWHCDCDETKMRQIVADENTGLCTVPFSLVPLMRCYLLCLDNLNDYSEFVSCTLVQSPRRHWVRRALCYCGERPPITLHGQLVLLTALRARHLRSNLHEQLVGVQGQQLPKCVLDEEQLRRYKTELREKLVEARHAERHRQEKIITDLEVSAKNTIATREAQLAQLDARCAWMKEISAQLNELLHARRQLETSHALTDAHGGVPGGEQAGLPRPQQSGASGLGPSEGLEWSPNVSRCDDLPDNPVAPPHPEVPKRPGQGDLCFALDAHTKRFVQAMVLTDPPTDQPPSVMLDLSVRLISDNRELVISERFIARHEPAAYRLSPGLHVIVLHTIKADGGRAYVAGVPGVIGSLATPWSLHRYLVLFDNETAAYARHDQLRLLLKQAVAITKEGHRVLMPSAGHVILPQGRFKDFLEQYLSVYPSNKKNTIRNRDIGERELTVLDMRDSKYKPARVVGLDCDLVRMRFYQPTQTDTWLFRGSTRFFNLAPKPGQQIVSRRHYVHTHMGSAAAAAAARRNAMAGGVERDLARHSALKSYVPKLAAEPCLYKDLKDLDGVLEGPLVGHDELCGSVACTPTCVNRQLETDIDRKIYGRSPYLAPLIAGWRRLLLREMDLGSKPFGTRGKDRIVYVTPCGRRLRSDFELLRFLHSTDSALTIDMFTFEPGVQPQRRVRSYNDSILCEDFSKGSEPQTPIVVVNQVDKEPPPDMEYSVGRFPAAGTELDSVLDDGFLAACQCTGNACDGGDCSCIRLGRSERERIRQTHPQASRDSYRYRRLYSKQHAAIYECNQRCACSKRKCPNRVAQGPLKLPLELFKTRYKGWGVKTLVDIARGQFVCVYAGAVRTSADANVLSKCRQGEFKYMADLDYIDTLENEKVERGIGQIDFIDQDLPSKEDKDRAKAGSHSRSPSVISDGDSAVELSDDDTADVKECAPAQAAVKTAASSTETGGALRRVPTATGALDEQAAPVASSDFLDSKPSENGNDTQRQQSGAQHQPSDGVTAPNKKSGMWLAVGENSVFGDPTLFVVDAQSKGNIGRFLNHSHDPNLFVQNVLFDTHDPRLPHIAFFAKRRIQAGEELCWDYQYKYDESEPVKIECRCGAKHCTGRLL